LQCRRRNSDKSAYAARGAHLRTASGVPRPHERSLLARPSITVNRKAESKMHPRIARLFVLEDENGDVRAAYTEFSHIARDGMR